MATRLTKSVSREAVVESTSGLQPDDKYIVVMAPEGLYIREKGKRTTFGPMGYGYLYHRAAMLTADRARAEKPSRRRRMKRSLI